MIRLEWSLRERFLEQLAVGRGGKGKQVKHEKKSRTQSMYPRSKLTTAQPQRVFVGLRNFKAKIWKEIETCLRSSTYFMDRVLKK